MNRFRMGKCHNFLFSEKLAKTYYLIMKIDIFIC